MGKRDFVKATHTGDFLISSYRKYPFGSFFSFEFFEITGNSHAVVKNNTERSLVHSAQFPPKVTFYKLQHNITTRILTLIQSANLELTQFYLNSVCVCVHMSACIRILWFFLYPHFFSESFCPSILRSVFALNV